MRNWQNTSNQNGWEILASTPYIPITCDNCGYTVFDNSNIAGLIDSEE